MIISTEVNQSKLTLAGK